MDLVIELGKENDIDELENLYNDLNDYLEKNTNYPGWKKGVYPIREDAINGIKSNNLYVAKYRGIIVGSIILNHKPEEAYESVNWQLELDYTQVFVIHTFVVNHKYMKMGIGKLLMDFVYNLSVKSKMKSIRLDVYEKNIPAINLYKKCGYKYIDTVDLGLGSIGLNNFKVYELII